MSEILEVDLLAFERGSGEQRRAVADAVLTNDGDLARLTDQVGQLWQRVHGWTSQA